MTNITYNLEVDLSRYDLGRENEGANIHLSALRNPITLSALNTPLLVRSPIGVISLPDWSRLISFLRSFSEKLILSEGFAYDIEFNPSLYSFYKYGTVDLDWLILLVNGLNSPMEFRNLEKVKYLSEEGVTYLFSHIKTT